MGTVVTTEMIHDAVDTYKVASHSHRAGKSTAIAAMINAALEEGRKVVRADPRCWLDEAESLVPAQRQIPTCPQDVVDKRRGKPKGRAGRP